MTKPILRPYNSVQPSAYNPRVTDPERLKLIALSLRKLGFLIPIYADAAGEILSGHQRHLVCGQLGVKHIPVVTLPKSMALDERKTLNVAFNRGTNDMEANDTPEELTARLQTADVWKLAETLPDLTLGASEFYPCLNTRTMPIHVLLQANTGRWVRHARNMNRLLLRKKVIMPIICAPDWTVVNGIGRLEALAESGVNTVDVVVLEQEKVAFATAMLNYLSMDFDLHNRYADFLRHNSFRRAATASLNTEVGYGFTMFAFPTMPPYKFKLANLRHRMKWERQHGTTILDFGAGRLKETKAMRKAGCYVSAFEPYYCGDKGDEILKEASIQLTRQFLRDVAAGKEWTSIFLSAVLNSVPFYQDRLHIVTIVQALCTHGRVYASANSNKHNAWVGSTTRSAYDTNAENDNRFVADFELHTTISNFVSNNPKVQKYHSPKEFADLWETGFQQVKVGYYEGQVVKAMAWEPRPVDPARLRAALEFEFDLPYPDGTRMGLADEAIAAFSHRLGLNL
ncbi:MAG: ParB N-terminal domain-containing protein [Anaerolinea sp.]|nr:ParB N-terminal domain-containing protein [Anaerolinea sp.]